MELALTLMKIITTDSKNRAVLYQVAAEVEIPLSDSTKKEIENMRIFYRSLEGKAGFAAPQIGLSKRILLVEKNLFDPNFLEETLEPEILINPIWAPIGDTKEIGVEGCLSVPGKMGFVERYINVELTALLYCPETEKLTKIRRQYQRELSSILWQHEIDHLDGEIYTDKAKLMLERSDFSVFMQHLVDMGKIQEGMSRFDIGPLIYELAHEWSQEQAMDLPLFLKNKKISAAPA